MFMKPRHAVRLNSVGTMDIDPELMEMLQSDQFCVEPKIDGTRAMLRESNARINIYGRGMIKGTGVMRVQRNYREQFPEIVETLENVPPDTVLDGEIVVLDDQGNPNFNLLQTRVTRKNDIYSLSKTYPAKFLVFDILKLNGKDFLELPLSERKVKLEYFMKGHANEFLDMVPYILNKDEKIAAAQTAIDQGFEGIMLKDLDSLYREGKGDWWKSKRTWTEDVFIMGKTAGEGRREQWFGGLQCYQMLDGFPVHLATIGGGFDDEQLGEFNELITEEQPVLVGSAALYKFRELDLENNLHVIEIEHFGHMQNSVRHPNYLRRRFDKSPEDCKSELKVKETEEWK